MRGPFQGRTVGVAHRELVEGPDGSVGVGSFDPGEESGFDPGRADDRAELLVVDDEHGPLALHDHIDLRRREPGVEVERVGADLRQRAGDLEEVPMVPAQDRDRVAGVDAGLDQPSSNRVGPGVEVAEAQRPALVDEGGVVAEPGGPHREQRGRPRAPVVQRLRGVPEPVRPLGPQDPGAQDAPARARRVGELVEEAGGRHEAMLGGGCDATVTRRGQGRGDARHSLRRP